MTAVDIIKPPTFLPPRSSTLRRFAASYAGEAVLSPFHAAALAGLLMGALLSQSAIPVLCGAPLAEALFLVALPRWPRFRSAVDRRRHARERAARDEARRAQLLRMQEKHRQHVDDLERIDASLRARLPAAALEKTCVDRLIDLYVKIAVVHDEAARLVDDEFIDEDTAPEIVCPETLVMSEERRRHRALALRRLSCRHDNQRRLGVLRDQLETIEAAVKLFYEQTILADDDNATAAKIEELVTEIEQSVPVVQTLLALSAEIDQRA